MATAIGLLDHRSTSPIRLGVSSCLLGNRVRYDGDHKRDSFITDTLGQFFEFVTVCPEMVIGMGVPRQPIRLLGDPERPRAVGVDDRLDVTVALGACARQATRELKDISGYIFKSKSPSCGIQDVKVYNGHGRPSNGGTGIFAGALIANQPLLPVEDETRLGKRGIRKNFIERVFFYRRWQDLIESGLTQRKLVEFHAIHRLTFMAHGNGHYRNLERIIRQEGSRSLKKVADSYAHGFMHALKQHATRKRHCRVLRHVTTCLRNKLDVDDRVELLDSIDRYRLKRLPLIVPVTLLNRHVRQSPYPDLVNQVYLNPNAAELVLRY